MAFSTASAVAASRLQIRTYSDSRFSSIWLPAFRMPPRSSLKGSFSSA